MSAALEILRIEPHHLQVVAQIHVRAFSDSSLSWLGVEAVRRYYEWQLSGPMGDHFIGVFKEGALRSYAVAGGTPGGSLSDFVLGNTCYLGWRILLRPGIVFSVSGREALKAALRILTRRIGKPRTPVQRTLRPKSFWVLAIAVDPSCQGQGLGRALMEELDRLALADCYSRMHLMVRPQNAKAVRFYEALGWRRAVTGARWEGYMEKEFPITPAKEGAAMAEAPSPKTPPSADGRSSSPVPPQNPPATPQVAGSPGQRPPPRQQSPSVSNQV